MPLGCAGNARRVDASGFDRRLSPPGRAAALWADVQESRWGAPRGQARERGEPWQDHGGDRSPPTRVPPRRRAC